MISLEQIYKKKNATLLENDDGEKIIGAIIQVINKRQLFQNRNLDPDEIERILEWRFPGKHIKN